MSYELVHGSAKHVALFQIGWPGALARMECSLGEWRMLKRRRLGWELIVENSNGHVVGWYSGRHWRAGGTIFLRSGPQLVLLNSILHGWTLQTVEREDPIMQMHGHATERRVELMPSANHLDDSHIAVLTTCAIPMVEEWFTPRKRASVSCL